MPMKVVHCERCGTAIRGSTFNARMTKIRRHYKRMHPRIWRESIRRGVRKRRKGAD